MYKVLITSRSFGDLNRQAFEILEKAGIESVKMKEPYQPETFAKLLEPCDALIIGAHPLEEEAVRRAKKLKFICKHGAGIDNLNMKMLRKYKVQAAHVPGVNADAVADLTFGLMLCMARKINSAAQDVKMGGWSKHIGTDVCYKTLGLIGFGSIARRVAQRASGFSMSVQAYDPYLNQVPDAFNFVNLTDLQTVISTSDFVSLHVPLTDESYHLMGEQELNAMKPGSFLINTARGGIVDEKALLQALRTGHLAGAGLDVLENEQPGSSFAKLDQVILTPHIGMYSAETINKVGCACAENVVAALSGKPVKNLL